MEQTLVQQNISMVKEVYLADIRNRMTNSFNDTVADGLTCPQNNYGQLIPHEILKCKDIVKKTIYNYQDPIVTVFSAAK